MPKKSENTSTGSGKKADKNFTWTDEETALLLRGLSQNRRGRRFLLEAFKIRLILCSRELLSSRQAFQNPVFLRIGLL